jgi:hypothetical protein
MDNGKAQNRPEELAGPDPANKGVHWCAVHKTEFKKFSKDGRMWYSYPTDRGQECRES